MAHRIAAAVHRPVRRGGGRRPDGPGAGGQVRLGGGLRAAHPPAPGRGPDRGGGAQRHQLRPVRAVPLQRPGRHAQRLVRGLQDLHRAGYPRAGDHHRATRTRRPGRSGPSRSGRSPSTGPLPAIANAIFDAVGVRLFEAPFTPEKVCGRSGRRVRDDRQERHWCCCRARRAWSKWTSVSRTASSSAIGPALDRGRGEVLDAGGLWVLPGRDRSPRPLRRSGLHRPRGFPAGSSAAASGGITTVIDMPCTSVPPVTSAANLREKLAVIENEVGCGLRPLRRGVRASPSPATISSATWKSWRDVRPGLQDLLHLGDGDLRAAGPLPVSARPGSGAARCAGPCCSTPRTTTT